MRIQFSMDSSEVQWYCGGVCWNNSYRK